MTVISVLVCGTISASSYAWSQRYYDPSTIQLGNGTTGTYSTTNSEKNAYFQGTATSTSKTKYTVKLSVSDSTTTSRALNPNTTQTVYWTGLYRDRTITWKLYNGGGTTLVSSRAYSTYE